MNRKNKVVQNNLKPNLLAISVAAGLLAFTPYTQAATASYVSIKSSIAGNKASDGATGLNAIAIGANSTSTGIGSVSIGVNSSNNASKDGTPADASVSVGSSAKTEGKEATAIGHQAKAEGNATTALGRQSHAKGGQSTAIGTNAKSLAESANSFGANATASGTHSTAIGSGAKASAHSSIAFGTRAEANGIASVGIGAGAKAIGLGSIAQGNNASASASNSIAVGRGAKATAANSIANGTSAQASGADSVAIGVGANAKDNFSVALGSNSVTAPVVGTNSATVGGVSYGGFAGSNPIGTVSVGAPGLERTLTNVAAGRITADSTDAINGSQLYSVLQNQNNRIGDIDKDLRAGIAGATAISFLQRPNEAGKSLVSAAVGGYKNQQALAIGYATNSDNNKWSTKLGVGVNTRKDLNWGGSIGYQW
ncbi:YadA family autotransporter adhesin [Neisseria animaloris]|uniref:YadA family autotransporter adhesin n=1 Tax=Neisseria animaloris TaxID=326522 RepID=UPI000D306C45|nr:YadA-like family protein [Neisseria animaloris]